MNNYDYEKRQGKTITGTGTGQGWGTVYGQYMVVALQLDHIYCNIALSHIAMIAIFALRMLQYIAYFNNVAIYCQYIAIYCILQQYIEYCNNMSQYCLKCKAQPLSSVYLSLIHI